MPKPYQPDWDFEYIESLCLTVCGPVPAQDATWQQWYDWEHCVLQCLVDSTGENPNENPKYNDKIRRMLNRIKLRNIQFATTLTVCGGLCLRASLVSLALSGGAAVVLDPLLLAMCGGLCIGTTLLPILFEKRR